MGQLAIVNAPASFTFIWSIIKPWLSKETANKVDILGSNYQEILLDLIDRENLPASLGGGCECEGGCQYSFAGPWKESTEERRQRRQMQAIQETKQVLAVNGVLSVDIARDERQAPLDSPTVSLDVAVPNGRIGNGEAVMSRFSQLN